MNAYRNLQDARANLEKSVGWDSIIATASAVEQAENELVAAHGIEAPEGFVISVQGEEILVTKCEEDENGRIVSAVGRVYSAFSGNLIRTIGE